MGENREAEYLRSLLARLEWAGDTWRPSTGEHIAVCRICGGLERAGHKTACELDAAIRPTEG